MTIDTLVLDSSKLDELCKMLGEQAAAKFIERFEREVFNHLSELQACQNDPGRLSRVAHKLVAVASALGLVELSDASQRLSCAGRRGDADVTSRCYDHVIAAADRARLALRDSRVVGVS